MSCASKVTKPTRPGGRVSKSITQRVAVWQVRLEDSFLSLRELTDDAVLHFHSQHIDGELVPINVRVPETSVPRQDSVPALAYCQGRELDPFPRERVTHPHVVLHRVEHIEDFRHAAPGFRNQPLKGEVELHGPILGVL